MRAVLQVLVLGVGVHGGHQPALDAERVVEHLGQRCQAVGGAGGVGDHVVGGRVIGRLVHAQDDGGDAVAGGGRRHDDLASPGLQVTAGVGGLGEPAGGLHDDLRAEISPGQAGRVALLEHPDDLVADGDGVVAGPDADAEPPGHRVVGQQVGQHGRAGQVVDRDDLQGRALVQGRAQEVAADPSESVDPDSGRHCVRSCSLAPVFVVLVCLKRMLRRPWRSLKGMCGSPRFVLIWAPGAGGGRVPAGEHAMPWPPSVRW